MEHEKVAQLYSDGVEAIVVNAASLTDGGWQRPACGLWDATDTARHVLGVAQWYGEWLDRALARATALPFPASEIDKQNSKRIEALQDVDGHDAIEQFQSTAFAYLARALNHWGLPYCYPYGTVTVGLHLGVAAAEWHLHAYDLAMSQGQPYEPSDAPMLFRAAGLCLAATKPTLQGVILRRLVPLGARSRPWKTILRQSGR